MQKSGSTLFNLSLLTADMWAVVIRIFFYQQQVQVSWFILSFSLKFCELHPGLKYAFSLQVEWLYYVSFAVVGVGLLIYSKTWVSFYSKYKLLLKLYNLCNYILHTNLHIAISLLTYECWFHSEKNPNLSQELENRIPNLQYQLVHEQGINWCIVSC